MKAIIIGATGATGKCLTDQLMEDSRFTEITVLVRRRYFSPHPKLKEIVVNFEELEKYSDEISGDTAFSCLGTTLKAAGGKEAQWKIDFDYQFHFAEWASKNKVPAFFLLSSMGANEKSEIFYSRMKGALEEAIKKLEFQHLIIFRPGPLIRPNTDRLAEKITIPVIKSFNHLGLLNKYKPLSVENLAKAMISKSCTSLKKYEIIHSKEIFSLIA